MKVYLAGKISKNDWRHKLVDRLNTVGLERWKGTKQLQMTTGDTYVGPFFVSCDHGCFHGAGGHGAADGDGCGDFEPKYKAHDFLPNRRADVRQMIILRQTGVVEISGAWDGVQELGTEAAQELESQSPGISQFFTDLVSTQTQTYTPPTSVGTTIGDVIDLIEGIIR